MDLSPHIFASFQKSVTLPCPDLSSLSFLHTGTALSYTHGSTLLIHSPIHNTLLNRIHVPDLRKALFLFEHAMLLTTPTHVRYLSTYDNTYIRVFGCEGVTDVHAALDSDTFMCVGVRQVLFYDLRSAVPAARLAVGACAGALSDRAFAVVVNHSVLKLFDCAGTAPRLSVPLAGHAQRVNKVLLTSDGQHVLLGTPRCLLVLSAVTGQVVHKLFVDSLADFDVADTSDYVYVLHDGQVAVHRLADKEMVMSVRAGEQKLVRVNPSYAQFVCAMPNITFYSSDGTE